MVLGGPMGAGTTGPGSFRANGDVVMHADGVDWVAGRLDGASWVGVAWSGATRGGPRGRPGSVGRVKRPFWMHQVVEYLFGIALVFSGLRSGTPAVPAVAGGLTVAHAAFSVGPLSAFRVLSRRQHRVTDLVVIGIGLLAAGQPWVRCDTSARFTTVLVSLAHLFVWWQTDFRAAIDRDERVARRAAARAQRSAGGAVEDRAVALGRKAGRLVGRGVRAARAAKAGRDAQR